MKTDQVILSALLFAIIGAIGYSVWVFAGSQQARPYMKLLGVQPQKIDGSIVGYAGSVIGGSGGADLMMLTADGIRHVSWPSSRETEVARAFGLLPIFPKFPRCNMDSCSWGWRPHLRIQFQKAANSDLVPIFVKRLPENTEEMTRWSAAERMRDPDKWKFFLGVEAAPLADLPAADRPVVANDEAAGEEAERIADTEDQASSVQSEPAQQNDQKPAEAPSTNSIQALPDDVQAILDFRLSDGRIADLVDVMCARPEMMGSDTFPGSIARRDGPYGSTEIKWTVAKCGDESQTFVFRLSANHEILTPLGPAAAAIYLEGDQ